MTGKTMYYTPAPKTRYEYNKVFLSFDIKGSVFMFRSDEFKCSSKSLPTLLTEIGHFGWELVGEIKGHIIVKREVEQ